MIRSPHSSSHRNPVECSLLISVNTSQRWWWLVGSGSGWWQHHIVSSVTGGKWTPPWWGSNWVFPWVGSTSSTPQITQMAEEETPIKQIKMKTTVTHKSGVTHKLAENINQSQWLNWYKCGSCKGQAGSWWSMLKDLRLENLAKMLKDKYITLLHNIIVQSHFILTMMVVGEGNKESGGQRRRKYRGGGTI